MKICIILRFANEYTLKNYFSVFSKENLRNLETNLFNFDLKFLMECKQNSLDFLQKLCDENGKIVDYVDELKVCFF